MKMLIFSMLAVALLLLAGCSGGQTQQGNQTGGNQTGLPNPASVYCEQHGGTLEIRTDAQGGQYGMCKFPNGGQCDEWAYYRAECNQSSGCACTLEYLPVCGVDGITYGNACGAKCAEVAIASQGECNSTTGGSTGTGTGGTGGTGLPNPASVNCVDKGGSLEIKEGVGGQYGVCTFPSGAKCEEWALFRNECSAEAPNYCEQDSDCACGKHITTGNCFYGQKEFVNTAEQCPDFCTGIAANFEIKCEQNQCKHINKLAKKCTDYTVDSCPTSCVVCPPCAECSSISCQTGEFCTSIGFNSTWYNETQHGAPAETCKNECGNGVCQEVVCMAIGCPCAETPASCAQDCAKYN